MFPPFKKIVKTFEAQNNKKSAISFGKLQSSTRLGSVRVRSWKLDSFEFAIASLHTATKRQKIMHTAFTRCFSVSVSEHLKAKHWNQQNHQRHILQEKCLKFVVWTHRVFFNIACKVSQNEIEELLSKRKRNLIPAGNACFPFVFDLQRHLPEKWFLSPGSRVGLPPFWPRARGRRLLLQLRKADLTKNLFFYFCYFYTRLLLKSIWAAAI